METAFLDFKQLTSYEGSALEYLQESDLVEIQGGGVAKPNEFLLGMGMIVVGIGAFAAGGGTLIVAGVYTAIDSI